jgi:hypothetical protein
MIVSPAVLGLENDCAGEDQQQLQPADPPYRQQGQPILTSPQLFESNIYLIFGHRWLADRSTDRRS